MDHLICDSCFMEAEDEGAPEGEEAMLMCEMGGELADHLCDEIESDGDIQCACSCHPMKRSAISQITVTDRPSKRSTISEHKYALVKECGVNVCMDCNDHEGLVRCYCGWASSGGNGYNELLGMGEQIESDGH
jgi:hypothetical protein